MVSYAKFTSYFVFYEVQSGFFVVVVVVEFFDTFGLGLRFPIRSIGPLVCFSANTGLFSVW